MNSLVRFLLFTLSISMVCAFSSPGTIFASARMDEIRNYLEQGDDKKAVILLETYFAALASEKNAAQGQQPGSDFLAAGYLLADMYAWRLNNPDRALEIYRVLDQSATNGSLGPGLFHKLFVAEIYACQDKNEKALQQLSDLLEQITTATKENDRELGQLFDGVEELIQYRIDTISLKDRTGKPDLAMPVIQLPVLKGMAANPFFTLWINAMILAGEGIPPVESAGEIIEVINNNPASLRSEVISFLLILETYGDFVDTEMDQVLAAYLSRYPETFFSILLRALFINYYEQEDMPEKAEKLVEEIRKIATKRNMQFITTPDPRFATPEKTWETYVQALAAGDLDRAMECHMPGDRGYRSFFTALGPEKLREVAENFGPIEKVGQNSSHAEFILTREIDGKDIAYPVIFIQLNEVWKIDHY